MKKALVVVLMLGACARSPRPGVPLGVDVRLTDALAWIQMEAQTEGVFCLTGAWERGKIVVDGVQIPHVSERSDSTVHYDGCEGRGIVGTWHCHVGHHRDQCEFSRPDLQTFRASGLLIDLLGCGRGEFKYLLAGDDSTHTLALRK